MNYFAMLKQVAPVLDTIPASVVKTASGYAGEGSATAARELTPLQNRDPFKIFQTASTELSPTSSALVPPPKLTAANMPHDGIRASMERIEDITINQKATELKLKVEKKLGPENATKIEKYVLNGQMKPEQVEDLLKNPFLKFIIEPIR